MKTKINYIKALPGRTINSELSRNEAIFFALVLMALLITGMALLAPTAKY